MADFTFWYDNAHGWLAVTPRDLKALNFTSADFTRYSYIHRATSIGDVLYLEEDCDATKFLKAWEAANGRRPTFEDIRDDRGFIRNLPMLEG